MANFAILRVQKLKSAISVHRSLKHSFRAQETPNAIPEFTPNNTHIGALQAQHQKPAICNGFSTIMTIDSPWYLAKR